MSELIAAMVAAMAAFIPAETEDERWERYEEEMEEVRAILAANPDSLRAPTPPERQIGYNRLSKAELIAEHEAAGLRAPTPDDRLLHCPCTGARLYRDEAGRNVCPECGWVQFEECPEVTD